MNVLLKVLRFSKLFGVGRTTSLPKIWKGTRKRKKQRSDSVNRTQINDTLNEDGRFDAEAASLKPIAEEKAQSTGQDGAVDDVFRLFEEDFR